MDLLNQVINCSDGEIQSVVTNALEKMDNESNKTEYLGFVNGYNDLVTTFNGFIPLDTRIKYASFSMGDYSMKTTDFYYDFARLIRENKLQTKGQLVSFIETFINSYFGINYSGEDRREQVLNDIAFQTSTSDDEYFEKLENNEIGSLKGMNIAMCTERSAMAQNLLSLYGFDSFYCMGCIDNNDHLDAHCFNIVKAKNNYILLDYSVPVPYIDKDKVGYLPFQGVISNEEFEQIISNQQMKSFPNYEYVKTDKGYQKKSTATNRTYRVGTFELELNQRINVRC